MVKQLRVMEKKLTNSGPFRESVDKHSIYPYQIADSPVRNGHQHRLALTEVVFMAVAKMLILPALLLWTGHRHRYLMRIVHFFLWTCAGKTRLGT